MRKVDIMRTSASRPNFLQISTESLVKYLKPNVEFRWILHEDAVNGGASDECVKYANECGVYSVIEKHSPPIKQGPSLGWLLDKCDTPYILNWEDDQELIKEIDIESLCNLMDNNPDINQIGFHKRAIMHQKPNFVKRQIVRDGIPLVTDNHWAFTPSLFRASYLKPKWVSFTDNVHWKMNEVLKGGKAPRDAEWVMKNTGTWWLGCIKHPDMLMKDHGFTQEEAENCDDGRYHIHLGTGSGSIRHGRYK